MVVARDSPSRGGISGSSRGQGGIIRGLSANTATAFASFAAVLVAIPGPAEILVLKGGAFGQGFLCDLSNPTAAFGLSAVEVSEGSSPFPLFLPLVLRSDSASRGEGEAGLRRALDEAASRTLTLPLAAIAPPGSTPETAGPASVVRVAHPSVSRTMDGSQ